MKVLIVVRRLEGNLVLLLVVCHWQGRLTLRIVGHSGTEATVVGVIYIADVNKQQLVSSGRTPTITP